MNRDVALESALIGDAVSKLPKGYNWGSVRLSYHNGTVCGMATCIDTGYTVVWSDDAWHDHDADEG